MICLNLMQEIPAAWLWSFVTARCTCRGWRLIQQEKLCDLCWCFYCTSKISCIWLMVSQPSHSPWENDRFTVNKNSTCQIHCVDASALQCRIFCVPEWGTYTALQACDYALLPEHEWDGHRMVCTESIHFHLQRHCYLLCVLLKQYSSTLDVGVIFILTRRLWTMPWPCSSTTPSSTCLYTLHACRRWWEAQNKFTARHI